MMLSEYGGETSGMSSNKEVENINEPQIVRQKKTLYFSDGTLEVDEFDGEVQEPQKSSVPVNPQELTWMPWLWHQTMTAGTKALEVCDYLGESLASFFGITTPKYQFEINEYNRMKKEEEEENRNDIELGKWNKNTDSNSGAVLTGPKAHEPLCSNES